MKCTEAKDKSSAVLFSTLRRGDTFIIDNEVFIMADRNGHVFPVSLVTGKNYSKIPTYVDAVVCELTYHKIFT